MQRTKKKLALDRMTVQNLSQPQLVRVAGGLSGSRCNPTETCHCSIESACSCTTGIYTNDACSTTC